MRPRSSIWMSTREQSFVVDVNHFRLGVEAHHFVADLTPAVAALLDPPKRHVREAANSRAINVNDSRLRALGETKDLRHVSCEDRRSQAVAHRVRYLDPLFQISNSNHSHQRTEYLFLSYLHALLCFDHRGREEVTALESGVFRGRAPSTQLSAFIHADPDVVGDAVHRARIDQRSHLDSRLNARAYANRRRARDKPAQKVVVDFLRHDSAARRGATLTRRAEAARDHPAHRQIEIGVVQHDLRVLASKLQLQLQHPFT